MTDGAHDHPLIAGLVVNEETRATAAEQALSARIAALETAPPPVIVPPPAPPTGAPSWWVPVATAPTTIPIPSGIDATGATDVTAALRTFIAGLPNNCVVTAGTGKTYKVSGSILLGVIKGKSNITFDGLGATLNNTAGNLTSTASNEASTWYWSWLDKPFPTHLTLRNWVGKGASTTPGKLVGSEFAAFAHFMGGTYLEVTGITGGGHWGDLVTLNENAQFVWVHGNAPTDVGRNNVSVVHGSHVAVEDNVFGKAGYCTFDIEPESGSGPITDIAYRRNKSGLWLNCFVAVDGANSGQPLSDIVIEDNTSTAGNLLSVIGFSGTGVRSRPQRVSFQRNHGPGGGSLKFSHVDGLVVKGNDGNVAVLDCPGAITS